MRRQRGQKIQYCCSFNFNYAKDTIECGYKWSCLEPFRAFFCLSLNERNRIAGNPLTPPSKAQSICSGRLNTDLFPVDAQMLRHMSAHNLYIRAEFWVLSHNRCVDVSYRPIMLV